MWLTRMYWTQAQMQMSALQHVDCPHLCGCDESLWSMSAWVTNWVWMRVCSDFCIVVLSVCGALIVLERQNAHEEIIVTLWPHVALIKTCFKAKHLDIQRALSLSVYLPCADMCSLYRCSCPWTFTTQRMRSTNFLTPGNPRTVKHLWVSLGFKAACFRKWKCRCSITFLLNWMRRLIPLSIPLC